MRWLVHGTISPAVADALVRHGHVAQTPEQAHIEADSGPVEVLEAAKKLQLDLMTTDKAVADAPFDHQFALGRSLVFLQLTGGEVEQDDAVDRLFKRYKRLSPGRLYTVTQSRVKVRQLPG